MASPVQVDMAIAKDKTYLGRRYVEVFRAKRLEYYKGRLCFLDPACCSFSPLLPAIVNAHGDMPIWCMESACRLF